MAEAGGTRHDGIESAYAWRRLAATLALSTIGCVGNWSTVVILRQVEAEFGSARAGASLPYTVAMVGIAVGGIFMGRLGDRFGVVLPSLLSALALALGYALSAQAGSLLEFTIWQGLLVGLLGTSAAFGPLIADISHWFERNRGTAMAVAATGNYLAGTVWPPILQHATAAFGWRATLLGVALFCLVAMPLLVLVLRRKTPAASRVMAVRADGVRPQAASGTLQWLLVAAGFTCCVAMAMPQVHIVAYCGDLGYGVARGAEMLSLMLGTGVLSRLSSGWIADRIGGAATLVLGSGLQALTLALYIPFDGLTSLFVVSALFGLSQGGIVPSYAMIVRERFPAAEVGTRLGLVLMATIIGMAAGGWMSGAIFDATGSYRAAFLNGLALNAVNLAIALWLLRGARGGRAAAAA